MRYKIQEGIDYIHIYDSTIMDTGHEEDVIAKVFKIEDAEIIVKALNDAEVEEIDPAMVKRIAKI